MGSKLFSLMLVLVLIAVGAALAESHSQKEVTELAQDCDDGGGILVRSFREKHEVWVCISEITIILKD